MRINQSEINILRELGEKYMEYASLPMQREKLRMWKALNRSAMERPMVVIDQAPWNELEAADPDALKCKIADPYWSGVERTLRKALYQWGNFPADMVPEPFITVPAAISGFGYGVEPDDDILIKMEGEVASSHHYNNILKGFEDISKIKDISFTYDKEQNTLNLQEAGHIFNGIAPVVLSHGTQIHLGVWDFLSMLMSVEDVYFDLIDRPDFLHAVMRRITDATLAGIKSANELNIYDDTAKTCHCSYTYTDELLPDFGAGKGATSKNGWAFGMAQLFTSVSRDVFAEYEVPYMSEMAEQLGMIYYGCCERLDDRLDLVQRIPNVRKVSCSPWSDRKAFAEKLDKSLIMSNKPTPAYLAGSSFDEDAVRKDIIETCEAAKNGGVNVELILKDISTVNNDPSRLTRWNDVAMETVEKYSF